MRLRVAAAVNGSTNALVGSGIRSMSDSWICWKPRMLEPCTTRPSPATIHPCPAVLLPASGKDVRLFENAKARKGETANRTGMEPQMDADEHRWQNPDHPFHLCSSAVPFVDISRFRA